MANDKEDLKRQVEKTLEELQALGDEIRVKIHLAGMDLKDKWKELEPLADDLRRQKTEASHALRDSAAELRDALRALRDRLTS